MSPDSPQLQLVLHRIARAVSDVVELAEGAETPDQVTWAYASMLGLQLWLEHARVTLPGVELPPDINVGEADAAVCSRWDDKVLDQITSAAWNQLEVIVVRDPSSPFTIVDVLTRLSDDDHRCDRCVARGQPWSGDPPKCGFLRGAFSNENWNCAALNQLRDLCESHGFTERRDHDCGSIGVLAIPEGVSTQKLEVEPGYLVLTWYKNRGRVNHARMISDEAEGCLNRRTAEAILAYYEGLNSESQNSTPEA